MITKETMASFDPEVRMTVGNIQVFPAPWPWFYVAFEDYEALREKNKKLVRALGSFLRNYKPCTHEETHRGGTIWTICDACGQKWADDEGGFQPYAEPQWISNARTLLTEAQ